MNGGVISSVRVTHRDASVDDIAAAGDGDARSELATLTDHPAVAEAYVLRTCNRAEAYVVTEDAPAGRSVLQSFVEGVSPEAVATGGHEESIRHLMRVAAGLESMVLGEDRVLGQVRDAYQIAREADALGPVLEETVTKATRVGERARTETAINEGVVSLGSAAAQLLDEAVDLSTATALLVGAGEVATSVAEAMAARDVGRVVVANRTPSNAADLAASLDAPTETTDLGRLSAAVARADVVVAATGSCDPLIDESTVADADAGDGDTWLVDMGQPRDVAAAVADVPGVQLHALDDLEAITERTRERRREAARHAETIVNEELLHLMERFKRKRADEVIAAMHESAERVKRRELRSALQTLEREGEFTDEQRAVVESLADTLVAQLLAPPTESLREAAAEDDWETVSAALELFDPDVSDRGLPDGPEGTAAVASALSGTPGPGDP